MPAAVMTYTSLSEDVLTYSERPSDVRLSEQIPRIVALAEAECAAELRVLGTELVATGTLTLGDSVIEKPSYWRSTTSISVTKTNGERKVLKKRVYEYLRNYWPDTAVTGEPEFYAEYNVNNFFVVPTPSSALAFEVIYQARLDPLSSENQTNWTTANAPQLLLYSCMYHASLFLKNFDKAGAWKASYDSALQALRSEDAGRSTDRTIVKG